MLKIDPSKRVSLEKIENDYNELIQVKNPLENSDQAIEEVDSYVELVDLSLEYVDLSLKETNITLKEIDISLEKFDTSFEKDDTSFEKFDTSFEKNEASFDEVETTKFNTQLSIQKVEYQIGKLISEGTNGDVYSLKTSDGIDLPICLKKNLL